MFKYLAKDVPASLVVFLVALPLCLGIALASGADPIAGLIAGIIGGIVVGFISGSAIGVSGPAAGLAVIVLNGINDIARKVVVKHSDVELVIEQFVYQNAIMVIGDEVVCNIDIMDHFFKQDACVVA